MSVPVPVFVRPPDPLITPETVPVPPIFKVLRPAPVERFPITEAPPVVVIFSAPPAVAMVSLISLIIKPPAPVVKVTLRPTVCARFNRLSVRLLIVMLLVAARETLVVAAIPSSSVS